MIVFLIAVLAELHGPVHTFELCLDVSTDIPVILDHQVYGGTHDQPHNHHDGTGTSTGTGKEHTDLSDHGVMPPSPADASVAGLSFSLGVPGRSGPSGSIIVIVEN